MFSWFWRRPAPPPAMDPLVAQLRSEIAYLRSERDEDRKEVAYLRRSLVALADRRAVAEIEFYREANAPGSPARQEPTTKVPQSQQPRDLNLPWANQLYGGGHIEEADTSADLPPVDDETLGEIEDEMAEATIERQAAERERRRIEEAS